MVRSWTPKLAASTVPRFGVGVRAAADFQLDVFEPLVDQCGAHIVVSEDGAIVPLSGFVQRDGEIRNRSGFELLGHALLHLARGWAHFELTQVRGIVNRVGADARACCWPGGQHVVNAGFGQ